MVDTKTKSHSAPIERFLSADHSLGEVLAESGEAAESLQKRVRHELSLQRAYLDRRLASEQASPQTRTRDVELAEVSREDNAPLRICFLNLSASSHQLEKQFVELGHSVAHYVPDTSPSNGQETLSSLAILVYRWLKGQKFDLVVFSEARGLAYYALLAKHQGITFQNTTFLALLEQPSCYELERKAVARELFWQELDFLERESMRLSDRVLVCSEEAFSWVKNSAWQLPSEVVHLDELSDDISRVLQGREFSLQNSSARPLVSICIPTRNRPEELRSALRSIEQLRYQNFEVIIVDDGSELPAAQSNLAALSTEQRGFPIKILHQERAYPGAARNLAAGFARGQYLLFLDDDNVITENALELLVCAASCSGAEVLTPILNIYSSHSEVSATEYVPLGGALAIGSFRNCFGDTFALFERAAFLRVGGFTEDYGIGFEDWELHARLTLAGYRLEPVPEVLTHYRHSQSGVNESTTLRENLKRVSRPFENALPDAYRKLLALNHGMHRELEHRLHGRLSNEPCHSLLLRKLFFSSPDILLSRNERTGFRDFKPNREVDIAEDASRLKLRCSGEDPQLQVPSFEVPAERSTCFYMRVISPVRTPLELFYQTRRDPSFSEERSLRFELEVGENDVFLISHEFDLNGVLRLDPGALPGDYTICEFEVRSLEPPRVI